MSSTLARRPTKTQLPDDNLEVVFIGDDLNLAELYRLKLEMDGYWVTTYPTIDGGMEHIRSRMPDLVFVDLGPGDSQKTDELRLLRSEARLQEVPIVLLARGELEAVEPKAFHLGGRDFLVRVDSVAGDDFWTEK